jgi:Cdc6-like AAA superfamily ATPase
MVPSLESESLGSLPGSLQEGETELAPRSRHKKLLQSWLFPVPCPCPVWCWGGIGTGKSFLLQDVMREAAEFGGKVAFVDCSTVMTANRSGKTLFESVLNQLSGHQVGSHNAFSSKWSCPNSSFFLQRLEELCKDTPCYIVFDNADALVEGFSCLCFFFFFFFFFSLQASILKCFLSWWK